LRRTPTRLLIGGQFTEVHGVNRNGIARLNADGSLDPTFDPGIGTDDIVFSVALQPDDKVLIAGYFTHVNGVSRNYIARLNVDGSLDTSFNVGSGADYHVYSLLVQPNGKILVGGAFTVFNQANRQGIVRLDADGSIDPDFNPRPGVSYFGIFDMCLQPDGKVVVAGSFVTVNGVNRRNIARLNEAGSLDPTFHPGTGPSESVTRWRYEQMGSC
jgi:uncharacterized delta-60 repeat protein